MRIALSGEGSVVLEPVASDVGLRIVKTADLAGWLSRQADDDPESRQLRALRELVVPA